MTEILVAARAAHYASLIQLCGIFVFLAFVATPAFRHADLNAAPDVSRFHGSLLRYVWVSVPVALLSGLVWLLLEAAAMSGRPPMEALSRGFIGVVLSRTQFGRDWALRFIVVGLLIAWLLCRKVVKSPRLTAGAQTVPLLLSAVLLAALAWVGHATDTAGRAAVIHLTADAIHLLAAGAWLGGLGPLALLFAFGRGTGTPVWLTIARKAAVRFSTMGLISVGALLLTGIVNTWFLSGTIPGLVGTAYGRLLLLKVGLFGLMVGIAAVNRLWLTPGLLGQRPGPGTPSIALRALQRNSLTEASLGLAILVIVGALGILTPAEHTQPWWPFPFALSTAALRARSNAQAKIVVAVVSAVIGFALLGLSVIKQRRRGLSLTGGVALLLGGGGVAVRLLSVAAYPTSFFQSPVPYTAPSIIAGAHLYADQCATCHGATGRGDGPAVQSAASSRLDLAAGDVAAQSDGDLFWWITQGRSNGAMPAFGNVLGTDQGWDIINFLRAQASGAAAAGLTDVVTAKADVPAPDFTFETGNGRQETLGALRNKDVVLLIYFTEPGSLSRLQQLARDAAYLESAGVRVLAVPRDDSARRQSEIDVRAPTLPFVIRAGPDVREAYALFVPDRKMPPHAEFLIDRAGYIRARWSPDESERWARTSDLLDQVWRLDRLGTTHAPVSLHVH